MSCLIALRPGQPLGRASRGRRALIHPLRASQGPRRPPTPGFDLCPRLCGIHCGLRDPRTWGQAAAGKRWTEGSARGGSSGNRALPRRGLAALALPALALPAARPSVPLRKPEHAQRAARTQRGGRGVALRPRGRGLCADSGSPG